MVFWVMFVISKNLWAKRTQTIFIKIINIKFVAVVVIFDSIRYVVVVLFIQLVCACQALFDVATNINSLRPFWNKQSDWNLSHSHDLWLTHRINEFIFIKELFEMTNIQSENNIPVDNKNYQTISWYKVEMYNKKLKQLQWR